MPSTAAARQSLTLIPPLTDLGDDQQGQDTRDYQRHAPVKVEGEEVAKGQCREVLDEQPHHVGDGALDVGRVVG